MSASLTQKLQAKPRRQSNGRVLWTQCQYTIAPRGQPTYICNAPTDNHAQYCKACAVKVLPSASARRDTIRT